MTKKFENMRVQVWCDPPKKWVLSHVKFLRAGNRFRVKKWGGAEAETFLATSDPYLRVPEKKSAPSLMEVAMNPEAIEMFDKPEPPYWTVNHVKER